MPKYEVEKRSFWSPGGVAGWIVDPGEVVDVPEGVPVPPHFKLIEEPAREPDQVGVKTTTVHRRGPALKE